jgi:uncharacterized NAD(P)/FAD-binding protein YdhS
MSVDVTLQGEVISQRGVVSPRLMAVGPTTRGVFWEMIAVPDIRAQVWNFARRLTQSRRVEGEGL